MDKIMERWMDLSLMQNIPNMAEYAEAWNVLAADMDAANRPYSAEACRSRFEFYRELAGGEYVRLIEQPFAELIEVPA